MEAKGETRSPRRRGTAFKDPIFTPGGTAHSPQPVVGLTQRHVKDTQGKEAHADVNKRKAEHLLALKKEIENSSHNLATYKDQLAAQMKNNMVFLNDQGVPQGQLLSGCLHPCALATTSLCVHCTHLILDAGRVLAVVEKATARQENNSTGISVSTRQSIQAVMAGQDLKRSRMYKTIVKAIYDSPALDALEPEEVHATSALCYLIVLVGAG